MGAHRVPSVLWARWTLTLIHRQLVYHAWLASTAHRGRLRALRVRVVVQTWTEMHRRLVLRAMLVSTRARMRHRAPTVVATGWIKTLTHRHRVWSVLPDMCLSLSLCHALLVVLASFTTYPVAWVSAVCVLWVSIRRLRLSCRASTAQLVSTRMIAASSVANRALVVDTRLWWVLCHVLSVSWASTRRLALCHVLCVRLDELTMIATHRHLASNAVLVSTQTLDRRAACLARLDMLTWTLMRRLSVQYVRVVTMPQWA